MNMNWSIQPAAGPTFPGPPVPGPPVVGVGYGHGFHTEIEFKFLASPAVLGQIHDSLLIRSLARGASRHQTLVSTYYDTPGLWFASHGLSLRVRWDGERWVQGLKARIEKQDGFFHRREWEQQIPSSQPVAARIFGAPEGVVISPEVIAAIEPLFETRFGRVAIEIDAPNRHARGGEAARIAMALDVGAIIAGGRSEAISEVELELVSGSVEALAEIAFHLRDAFDLRPGHLSKGKRGYRLAGLPIIRQSDHAQDPGVFSLRRLN